MLSAHLAGHAYLGISDIFATVAESSLKRPATIFSLLRLRKHQDVERIRTWDDSYLSTSSYLSWRRNHSMEYDKLSSSRPLGTKSR